jgi:hypothetical protein
MLILKENYIGKTGKDYLKPAEEPAFKARYGIEIEGMNLIADVDLFPGPCIVKGAAYTGDRPRLRCMGVEYIGVEAFQQFDKAEDFKAGGKRIKSAGHGKRFERYVQTGKAAGKKSFLGTGKVINKTAVTVNCGNPVL